MTIAVISFGLARSVLIHHVAQSFALMTSSLYHGGGDNVGVFMLLGNDKGNAELSAKVHQMYNLTELWVVNGDLECNKKCDLSCGQGHDTPFQFLAQFGKAKIAHERVVAWENKKNVRFSWYLRVRPDLLWFEPFPPLSQFKMSEKYVPSVGMTDSAEWAHVNDHIFLCPRALCKPYFTGLIESYQACSGNSFQLLSPPQRSVFDTAYGRPPATHNNHGTQVFDVGYTVAREGGPKCNWLCDPNNKGTTNQSAHFGIKCKAMVSTWGPGGEPGAIAD